MTPIVSVLIPTFNRPQFVDAAIRSVLAQTFADFELIVIDNGSTDETSNVIRSFDDPRVRCSRIAVNNGVSPARNRGIELARGEFIAFLDDDDEWLPDKLSRQLDLLKRSSADVAAVYTGYYKIDRRSGELIQQIQPSKRGYLFNDLCIESCVGTASTVLLRTECLAKTGGFDEGILFGEEYDLWIRIARHFRFECLQEPLVRYSVHATNATLNYGSVIQGLEAQDRKYAAWFASNKKAYSERYLSLGILYCYTGDVRKGRKAFIQAMRLYPFDPRNHYYWGVSLLGAERFKKIKRATERLTLGAGAA